MLAYDKVPGLEKAGPRKNAGLYGPFWGKDQYHFHYERLFILNNLRAEPEQVRSFTPEGQFH